MSKRRSSKDTLKAVAVIGRVLDDGDGAIVFQCPYCEEQQMVTEPCGAFCSTEDCLTVLSIRATYKTETIQGACHGV